MLLLAQENAGSIPARPTHFERWMTMSSSKPEAKHEPLTNAELVILANREYDVEHIGERAVATIRELGSEKAALLAALEKYGQHLGCAIEDSQGRNQIRAKRGLVPVEIKPCSCGLDAELASGGKADSCQPSAISSEPEIKNPPDVLNWHLLAVREIMEQWDGRQTDGDLCRIIARCDPVNNPVLPAAEPAGHPPDVSDRFGWHLDSIADLADSTALGNLVLIKQHIEVVQNMRCDAEPAGALATHPVGCTCEFCTTAVPPEADSPEPEATQPEAPT